MGESWWGSGRDMEVRGGHLGSCLDGVLGLVFLLGVAWPDQWLRVVGALLVAAFDIRSGDAETDLPGGLGKLRKWERRVVCWFFVVVALSKLVWRAAAIFAALAVLRRVAAGNAQAAHTNAPCDSCSRLSRCRRARALGSF